MGEAIHQDGAGGVAGGQESVARILRAAESCFRRYGFDGTSVRRIADAAGVSKSLVLYHFRCKEQLYVDVQLRIFRRLADAVQSAAAEARGAPLDRALFGLDALVGALREHNDLAAHAVLGVRALSSPRLRVHLERMRTDLRALMAASIERLLGPEALPMGADTAADVVSAALTGIGLQAALEDPPERIARNLDGLRALIRLALERPAGGGR